MYHFLRIGRQRRGQVGLTGLFFRRTDLTLHEFSHVKYKRIMFFQKSVVNHCYEIGISQFWALAHCETRLFMLSQPTLPATKKRTEDQDH